MQDDRGENLSEGTEKKTTESKNTWIEACKHASRVITSVRDTYYNNQLIKSAKDKKKTYSIVNNLLDRNTSKACYPIHKPDEIVASEMKDNGVIPLWEVIPVVAGILAGQ